MQRKRLTDKLISECTEEARFCDGTISYNVLLPSTENIYVESLKMKKFTKARKYSTIEGI